VNSKPCGVVLCRSSWIEFKLCGRLSCFAEAANAEHGGRGLTTHSKSIVADDGRYQSPGPEKDPTLQAPASGPQFTKPLAD